MSRMKLLLEVINDIRTLADSLQDLADAVASGESQETSTTEPVKEKAKPQAATKNISLEDVRAALAKKSQQGFTAEVRILIEKYGAKKLSEIGTQHYEEILKAAEGLTHE